MTSVLVVKTYYLISGGHRKSSLVVAEVAGILTSWGSDESGAEEGM